MQKIMILMATACLASLFACGHSQINENPGRGPIKIDTSQQAELRAALVTLIAASKNPDDLVFLQLIHPKEKQTFDAREWNDAGYIRRYKAAIASIRPKDYTLDLAEGHTDFHGVFKKPEAVETQKVWICLMRDGSTWKLASPPPPQQPVANGPPGIRHQTAVAHKKRTETHRGKTR